MNNNLTVEKYLEKRLREQLKNRTYKGKGYQFSYEFQEDFKDALSSVQQVISSEDPEKLYDLVEDILHTRHLAKKYELKYKILHKPNKHHHIVILVDKDGTFATRYHTKSSWGGATSYQSSFTRSSPGDMERKKEQAAHYYLLWPLLHILVAIVGVFLILEHSDYAGIVVLLLFFTLGNFAYSVSDIIKWCNDGKRKI